MAYSIVKPIGYYVYTHRKASNGVIFYVGKGLKERAWDQWGRSDFWNRIVKKHGVVVCIESEGLLEFEAYDQERAMVEKLKLEGIRLCNLTDGGDGGFNPCQSTRDKISAFQKGRKKSSDHIEKIRVSNTGQKRTEATKQKLRDRVYSEDARNNMRISALLKPAVTEITKLKLKESSLNNWNTVDYRLKVIRAVTGLKRDAEFCEKMRLQNLARPPRGQEEREAMSLLMLKKWEMPAYREYMRVAHTGAPWSEARRSSHEAVSFEVRSASTKAARAKEDPVVRSNIARAAALKNWEIKRANGTHQGEHCNGAKLTADSVREIRRLTESGSRKTDLGKMFNVSRGAIAKILNGQTWTHVT